MPEAAVLERNLNIHSGKSLKFSVTLKHFICSAKVTYLLWFFHSLYFFVDRAGLFFEKTECLLLSVF